MIHGPIALNTTIFLPADAIQVTAVRASGPGGQNVNKVSSKIDMKVRFSMVVGMSLEQRMRLRSIVRERTDSEGLVRFTSQRTRDQARNYEDACEKVREILRVALIEPVTRRKTRPTRSSVERRLDEKRKTSERKRHRERTDD